MRSAYVEVIVDDGVADGVIEISGVRVGVTGIVEVDVSSED